MRALKCRLLIFPLGKLIFLAEIILYLSPIHIVNTDAFDNPNLPGEMRQTVTLKPVSYGTELHILREGLPGAIPVETCYLGW